MVEQREVWVATKGPHKGHRMDAPEGDPQPRQCAHCKRPVMPDEISKMGLKRPDPEESRREAE